MTVKNRLPQIRRILIRNILAITYILFSFKVGVKPIFSQYFDIPEPQGYVNDFENIIDEDDELEKKLKKFEENTSNEIVVVTYPDLQGSTIEDFAGTIFDTWEIGKEDKDNGLLIFVSAGARESRIEVGYGLESILTDAKTGRIQDQYMIPYFKSDEYSEGINNGVDAVISELSNNEVTQNNLEDVEPNEYMPSEALIYLAFILMFIIAPALANSKEFISGGILGFIGGLIIGAVFFRWWGLFIFPVFLGFLGLAIDYVLSRFRPPRRTKRQRSRISPGGLIARSIISSSIGSSKSGSSFGGFGGGSRGGGGSSRSW